MGTNLSQDIQKATRTPSRELNAIGRGLLAETFPLQGIVGFSATSACVINYSAIGLRADTVVTNIVFVQTASAVSGTSGTGTFGLYDEDGNQRGVTADVTSTLTASATGPKSVALTTAYTIPTHGLYYIAALTTYDTDGLQPTLGRGAQSVSAGRALGTASRAYAAESTAVTLPTTATFADGASAVWFGVS